MTTKQTLTVTQTQRRQLATLFALSVRQNNPLQLSPIYRAGRGPLGSSGGPTPPPPPLRPDPARRSRSRI